MRRPTSWCTSCGSEDCSPATPLPCCLPNRAEVFVVLMALFQAGWNFVPLNSNLTAAEVTYILGDSGAKVLVADERFAAVAGAAAVEAVVPESGRISVGAPGSSGGIPGFTPLHAAVAGRPDGPAGGPARRPVHAVHLGHDRAPEGGPAHAPLVRPRDMGARLQRQSVALRHRAGWGRGASGDVADVPHVPVVLRLLLGPLRTPSCPHGEMECRGGIATH